MISKKDFEELIRTVDAILQNFDLHLEHDHHMKATGYDEATKTPATLRFYLANCHGSLQKLLGEIKE